MSRLDVAFVTSRFGPDVFAGSEIAVGRIARALPSSRTTVYCTTLRDFDDRRQRYSEGPEHLGDLLVRRFDPDPQDSEIFFQLSQKMEREPLTELEEETWISHCFNSAGLLEALRESDHDVYFFTPYLRATTYFGVQAHPEKSVLLPALHDEPPAHFAAFKDWFPSLAALAFNSRAEQRFANRLYDLRTVPQRVLGIPIPETVAQEADAAFAGSLPHHPFLLFVGRLEVGKGVLDLVEWVDSIPDVELVVVGEGDVALPRGSVHFPRLSESELNLCYRKALATIQLSVLESFSIVLFESWLQGTPVIVSALSEVTREACLRADGGLAVSTCEELKAAVQYLKKRPAVRDVLGQQGRQFTQRHFSVSAMGERYQAFFSFLPSARRLRKVPFFLYSQNFLEGDAVSNYVDLVADVLEAHGLDVSIHVEGTIERNSHAERVSQVSPEAGAPGVHWFQYPAYYPLIRNIEQCGGFRIFDFHGVTPASLWANQELSASHRNIELASLAQLVLVHSRYMGEELLQSQETVSERVRQLPLGVDTDLFRPGPKDPVMEDLLKLSQGTVLLSVGRLAPNKRPDVLVEALARLSPGVTLVFVGDVERPEYAGVMENCLEIAARLGVRDQVIFAGKVSDQRLARLYRTADVFVSATLHEGFGIPFLEAMASGIPCVGSRVAAVPEVIGPAGLLFEPEDSEMLAQCVNRLTGDGEFYSRCVEKGLERAQTYSIQAFGDRLMALLCELDLSF